ncbi:MAG: serine/threonine protein kinase, partial [Bifidobacteriaceae bacterium]|nr:serine/threonine protein kinase [Bifidobacteriaceae bacterium]
MIASSGLLLSGGHYKLVSRIAVGGMGEVWRAHDLVTNLPVAIKVLRPEFTGDPVSLKRLRFEARNAAMLNHPNITQVLDYGETEGTGYLVMEYVEGQSLADVLATHSAIAPLRLLPILIQAALGLHAAHVAGVVHRDVKPGNILLGPSDLVKLTDFGISVAHGQMSLTDTGKVMGTAQYLSPEQALGNPAQPLGDLYSLGVIAYEALAGHRPFRGANYVAIALAQVNEKPPPLPASVEKTLAALVMRLMEKDPTKRPADGAQLAELLGDALEVHRELASRLLTTRRGDITAEPLRTHKRGASPNTMEQPAVTPRSIMPPPAPITAAAPMVEDASTPAFPLPIVASTPVLDPIGPKGTLGAENPDSNAVDSTPKESRAARAIPPVGSTWETPPPLPDLRLPDLDRLDQPQIQSEPFRALASPLATPIRSEPADLEQPASTEEPDPTETVPPIDAEDSEDPVEEEPEPTETVSPVITSDKTDSTEKPPVPRTEGRPTVAFAPVLLPSSAPRGKPAANSVTESTSETELSPDLPGKTPPSDGLGRFPQDWWAPLLVALGLIAIILIGLFTAL